MFNFTYTPEMIANINASNLLDAQIYIKRHSNPTHYSNYPWMTLSQYEEGGKHFVRQAFAAYAAGDETLGDLHASCAERYFMRADIVRGHIVRTV